MSSSRFFTSRTFLIQIIIAIILVFLLIFIVLKVLEVYTRHGQSYPVPDFYGMTRPEASKVAQHNNLRIEVVDSVFVDDIAPGAIVDQVPEAGHGVKQNRKVFVSINSTQPEMVTVPQLTDISYRQAQVLLENSGFNIGQIDYRPSQFHNLVLEVKVKGRNIKPGQSIPKGTEIDMIIGRTQGNSSTALPNLTGLYLTDAEQTLTDGMLNTGVVIYDNTISTATDSAEAIVWRQRPDAANTSSVMLGSFIDLWVTTDTLKVNQARETGF